MRRSASVVAIVITTVLAMGTAFATPPSGDIKFEDWARVQSVDAATIPINAGFDLVSGQYSIASGGQTGWRELPGTMILLVTKGTMMLHGGEGCAAKELATGKGTVVGGGVYSVHNAGKEQLDFFGMFLKQAPGSPQPLSEGPTVAAPAGCSGALAAEPGATSVSLKTPAAGTFVDAHYTAHHSDFEVKKDLDALATHYDFGPGASTGWISHLPALNIVEEGELGYVEAKDGKCDESETYTAGDAFYHPPHRHIAYNRGQSRLKLTVVFFNLPHNTPLPVIGNQTTAVDFTQAPPADCVRAR